MKILHKIKREIAVPLNIVIENFLDLDHVNFIHKRCYKYCNVISRIPKPLNSDIYANMFLEVGAYPIPGIPISFNYLMYHEYIPPNKIIHFSQQKNSKTYVRSQIDFWEKNGKTYFEHTHVLNVSILYYPFKNLIIKCINRWSDILWEEDSELMLERHDQVKKGFRDGVHCGKWMLKDGKPIFNFYKIKQ